MTARFGLLTRVAYPIDAVDDEALEAGELDPAHAFVTAAGVPDPHDHPAGSIVDVEWRLDKRPRAAIVTFWNPK